MRFKDSFLAMAGFLNSYFSFKKIFGYLKKKIDNINAITPRKSDEVIRKTEIDNNTAIVTSINFSSVNFTVIYRAGIAINKSEIEITRTNIE